MDSTVQAVRAERLPFSGTWLAAIGDQGIYLFDTIDYNMIIIHLWNIIIQAQILTITFITLNQIGHLDTIHLKEISIWKWPKSKIHSKMGQFIIHYKCWCYIYLKLIGSMEGQCNHNCAMFLNEQLPFSLVFFSLHFTPFIICISVSCSVDNFQTCSLTQYWFKVSITAQFLFFSQTGELSPRGGLLLVIFGWTYICEQIFSERKFN